jgi:hypothetical protein
MPLTRKEKIGFLKKFFWRLRVWIKRVVVKYALLIEFCKRCGCKQPLVWRAPDEVWLKINNNQSGGVFCPECFDSLAQEKGISLMWQPKIEFIRKCG